MTHEALRRKRCRVYYIRNKVVVGLTVVTELCRSIRHVKVVVIEKVRILRGGNTWLVRGIDGKHMCTVIDINWALCPATYQQSVNMVNTGQ